MRGEDFFEEGTVVRIEEGNAVIRIHSSDACEECSAKLFCTPGAEEDHTVMVTDPLGVRVGDTVRILVRGETMFKAAALLYGAPLLLLLCGLLLGMEVFDPMFTPRELFAFALGLGMSGTWYLVIFLSGGAASKGMMPSIDAITSE